MGQQDVQEEHTKKSGPGVGKYLGMGSSENSGAGSKGRTLEKTVPSTEWCGFALSLSKSCVGFFSCK